MAKIDARRFAYMELLSRMALVLNKHELSIVCQAAGEDPEFSKQFFALMDNELHTRSEHDDMQVVGRRIKAGI